LADWRGRPVSKQEVRNLSKAEAAEIYRARYWGAVQGDHLPYGFDLVAMDGGVNSGPRRGAKWLQVGVGTRADGKVGPKTIEAARRSDVDGIERACDARMSFLRALSHWDAFGRGWSRRVASVEAVATRMWVSAAKGKTSALDTLREAARRAMRQAKDERRIGATQTSATGAGGAGGAGIAADGGSPEATVAIALVAIVVAALLFIRSRRREKHQEDRREAFTREARRVQS
jgi:lysozyme family protein